MVTSARGALSSLLLICVVCNSASHLAAATSEPASAPTTAPSTAPSGDAGETITVKRGTLKLALDVDGTFEPIQPFEARVRTKAFQGDLLIVKSVAPGTPVKRGDVILQIDPKPVRQQIAAAENELTLAKANLAKSEADLRLGRDADALAMTDQKTQLAVAEQSLKWWDDVDQKTILGQGQLQEKVSAFYVESEEDSLDQLRKMYKSEDLTNATSDIVVKRAIRMLDIYKFMQGLMGNVIRKMREFEVGVMRVQVSRAIDRQKQSQAQLQVDQDQAAVVRQTSLTSTKLAAEKAEEKLGELKKDLEFFSIQSSIDGTVAYGSFNQGAWQEIPERQLREGEKVTANQVVMTVFVPGKLRATMQLPETKLFSIKQGLKVKVTPTAMSETTYGGTCGRVSVVASGKGAEQTFDVPIELPAADERLAPGYKVIVKADLGKRENVLIVPISAVTRGRVWFHRKDEAITEDEAHDVVVGQSDGLNVEIVSGLNEGDVILKQAKK